MSSRIIVISKGFSLATVNKAWENISAVFMRFTFFLFFVVVIVSIKLVVGFLLLRYHTISPINRTFVIHFKIPGQKPVKDESMVFLYRIKDNAKKYEW